MELIRSLHGNEQVVMVTKNNHTALLSIFLKRFIEIRR